MTTSLCGWKFHSRGVQRDYDGTHFRMNITEYGRDPHPIEVAFPVLLAS
jgi:hypothetical protein